MTDGAPDPVWVQTLTVRLRSLYGGREAGGPRGAAADPAPAGLLLALERQLASLRRITVGPRYEVQGSLAKGGMGHVLAARDRAIDRPVALKRAAAATRAADAVRHRLRLLAEAAVIGRLQHPGVVPIHDVGVDEHGEPFFAMQRVDGRSFAELLAGHRTGATLPLPRAIEILRRVAETMSYAHARGVVHRDLKPQNIMVGAYGEVYVMDWGLARTTDGRGHVGVAADATDDAAAESTAGGALTLSGTVLGTPAYMAPERADGCAGAASPSDPRADVYGVGAMLYEVLAGTPPYAGERADWSVVDLLAAIRERPPRPVRELEPGADPELVAIQQRAMARDAARRYPDMAQLDADLRAWAEHRIVQAHGGGLGTHVRKWVRRNRPLAVTAAAALSLLLTATIWFVVGIGAARDRASAAAEVAAANLQEVLDLAVVQRVADLRQRADVDLWPLRSDRVEAVAAWLAEAEPLRAAQANLTARRDRLDAEAAGATEAASGDRTSARWRRQLLDEAIAALDAFFAPLPPEAGERLPLDSSVAAVRQRVAAARVLAAASTDGDDAAAKWRAAVAAVRASARYRGLELLPQPGLLPLGADPRTGLWEFAHLQTGAAAVRQADGTLRLADDSGVVLVLLPGGTFAMGASADDPRHPDPWAEAINEGPVHDVALAPFFASKFELTQGQWQRVTGQQPSVHTAISDFVDDAAAPRHPVESVDWWEARRVLRTQGLLLPTEAQWEYAARAGTDTPWYCGSSVDDLLSPPAGNLADAASAQTLGTQGWLPTPGLHDGFVMHAPVGSFAPNAFGLYDVIGNVAEWCEDEYVGYSVPPLPDTGGRPLSASPTTAMYRGGAFDEPAQEARSANRAGGPPTRRHMGLGLRPVRLLER